METMSYMGYTCSAHCRGNGRSWVGYIEIVPIWKLRITGKTQEDLEETFRDTVSRMAAGLKEIGGHYSALAKKA